MSGISRRAEETSAS